MANPMDAFPTSLLGQARMQMLGRGGGGLVGQGTLPASAFAGGDPIQAAAAKLGLLDRMKAMVGDETGAMRFFGKPSIAGTGSGPAIRLAGSTGGGATRLISTPGGALMEAAPLAEGAAAGGLLGGSSLMGAVGRAAPWAIGGQVAGGISDSLGAPSEVGSTLKGAGLGAAVGSVVPVLGTGLGAGIGAAAGLGGDLLGLWGGKDDKAEAQTAAVNKQQKTIKKTILQLAPQLSASAQAQLAASLKATSVLPKDQRLQARAQILQQIPDLIGQQSEQRSQMMDQLRGQMLVGMMMGGMGQQGLADANSYQQQLQSILPSLPGPYQGMANQMGNTAVYNAGALNNAYQAALQAGPVVDTMNSQLSQLNQLKQQIAAMQSGGGQTLTQALGG